MHIKKQIFHKRYNLGTKNKSNSSPQALKKLLVFLTQVKIIYNKILAIPIASGKQANLMQNILVLIKLKNSNIELPKMLEVKQQNKQSVVLGQDFFSQGNLKPSSTVTGFKKFMYNSVKLSQNQLQPNYNRRKYNHSYYNQTLKEITRLSRIYGYLSRNQIKNYCGFTVKPTRYANSRTSLLKKINLPEKVNKKVKTKTLLKNINYNRPIPKLVNFLESRLDVIIWRNQLSTSIRSARQHPGRLEVNASLQKKISYQTISGDVFTWLD